MTSDIQARVLGAKWDGDLDGALVIELDGHDALRFDRPGDVVLFMTGRTVDPPELFRAIACACLPLATRGIQQAQFVRPIVDKTTPFAASCDPPSLVLFREVEEIRQSIKDSESEGLELRSELLEIVRSKLGAANPN